jgi:hypothetical protein
MIRRVSLGEVHQCIGVCVAYVSCMKMKGVVLNEIKIYKIKPDTQGVIK